LHGPVRSPEGWRRPSHRVVDSGRGARAAQRQPRGTDRSDRRVPRAASAMIVRDEVMDLLVAACPSFEEPWREYLGDPSYERGLLYIDLGTFARHLVKLRKAGRTSEFERVFREIERLHTEGDLFVREAATIGLLEGIQNVAGNSDLDPESFRPYLHAETA